LFEGKAKDFSETVGNGKGSVTEHVTGDSIRTSSCISFLLREELSNFRLINRDVFKSGRSRWRETGSKETIKEISFGRRGGRRFVSVTSIVGEMVYPDSYASMLS